MTKEEPADGQATKKSDVCLLISAQCAYKTKLKINFLTISLICVFKVHISQIQEVVESDAFVE